MKTKCGMKILGWNPDTGCVLLNSSTGVWHYHRDTGGPYGVGGFGKGIPLNECGDKFLGRTPVVGGYAAIGNDGKVKIHTTAKSLKAAGASIFVMNARGNDHAIAKIVAPCISTVPPATPKIPIEAKWNAPANVARCM